jgi:hypothetical protein
LRRNFLIQEIFPLLFLTLLAFLVMGYHPGFEDGAVYLAAVKAKLNPALFPHDAQFFTLQMQASLFDTALADFVRLSHIPLAWAELFWQFAALFLILWASRRIAAILFDQASAQWAAVAMLGAMFTLPVAGTALNIADQHLHPRNLATALIVIAVLSILEGRWNRWRAVPLLLLALLLHPLMAALGISFCAFLLAFLEPITVRSVPAHRSIALLIPMSWLFAPQSTSWRVALASKSYYSVYRWTWYEWLGALAPLFLFWVLWRIAQARGRRTANLADERLARFALTVLAFGVFQQALAMLMLASPWLVRLTPLQPMRYLQLVYLFMALVAGGLMGRFVLKTHVWRWAAYLLVLNGGMFLVQWEHIDAGNHLELPGRASSNPWLQAFDWIRQNTPTDAYFALDPSYMAAPGQGYHGFRALAERSQLADNIKDTSVVTQVPSLAPEWQNEQRAQAGWSRFSLPDFERLKARFGVDWVLVEYPQPSGLDCRWHNEALSVCRIP